MTETVSKIPNLQLTKKQLLTQFIKEDDGKSLKRSCKIWKTIIPGNIKNYPQVVRSLAQSGWLRWSIILTKQLSDSKHNL